MQPQLADYEFVKLLGQGNFGSVFKVRDQTGESWVIKKITVSGMDENTQEDVAKEAKVMGTLNNPYIVQYKESFIEEGALHIVMEFCKRGDLSEFLQAQRGQLLPEARIWKFFIQMCLGLEYLHSQHILHRDIKAMNVFLTKDDTIRIGDLGVAKVLSHTAAYAQTFVGTPYYLSPELCEEQPYNVKSDVWALGCVLYELCTLKHPFEAKNQGALILKIMRARIQPIDTRYSADLQYIVGLLLQKTPAKRPSVQQLLRSSIVSDRVKSLRISVPTTSVIAERTMPICLTTKSKRRIGRSQCKYRSLIREPKRGKFSSAARLPILKLGHLRKDIEDSLSLSDSDEPIPLVDSFDHDDIPVVGTPAFNIHVVQTARVGTPSEDRLNYESDDAAWEPDEDVSQDKRHPSSTVCQDDSNVDC